jgi:hypothetical protein
MAFDKLRPNGLGGDFLDRLLQVGDKLGERPLDAAGAADQDMIGAGDARLEQDRPRELAQAALHPVADDRIADPLRDGEAEPDRGIAVAARPDEQDEAGRGGARSAVGREELRAAPQLADGLRG